MTRRVRCAVPTNRVSLLDTTVQKYGILLVPVALVSAILCFRAMTLNSEWLLLYCIGSFAFSSLSFWALRRVSGLVAHFALMIVGTTACLSVGAAVFGIAG